ncbi:bifunctional ADP-dependent NAD(P)H-hydrate dehydratase/NAD(P)H-hydrate epimerase [Frankia sp. CNm7]|uniref:ADP-dependent (S)-NAD(P)H-hydrate dehydratase n=2 Tax=Frankia nepalensis TaxID=1836974 RepID=A0A937RCA4_9ACTN|nr:bifunctional ADP-dependent NAD(P)H-hydrate dehydratase/NAD(P)H-hydrate epimerase [Frankia nepalensis]MBL7512588.1 bifunctional ADP-dependent NAD(P)H-hydrate dehydratase/NAD(P)H-hydrate epimerase [Frankia nepalensis]MBL7518888.1 bifunctional ADP-dependent NAD(P)H-hydrate dehydratase/NAD(P)H-hydrate epimerase [Frankia nepalensis]MBL7627207.1 bifunctional ADP-dependent NAD(P)H-hydrate dehydratase/NAD(P)H-hydrate epimerase [Frankia nepalensis]
MQRAVYGLLGHAARRLDRQVYGRRVVVLAGGGDNGGDALWTGARLAARGARVDALAPGGTHQEGTAALLAAGGRLHRVVAPGEAGLAGDGGPRVLPDERVAALLAGADLVLDGLLGIGGRPGLRGAHARLAELAPPERTIAVDVPSGVDADTGAAPGTAVRAALTVTFGTYKRGLLLGPGATHTGELALVDIGLDLPVPDLTALDDADVAALLPAPGPGDTKYTRGVLGLVGGSDRYPGAIVLATGGALRGGAGYLRVVAEARAAEHVCRAHPEAVVTVIEPGDAAGMLDAGRVQAWALGPGVVPGPEARRLLDALVATDLPLLLDAGGLDLFAEAFAAGFSTRTAGVGVGFTTTSRIADLPADVPADLPDRLRRSGRDPGLRRSGRDPGLRRSGRDPVADPAGTPGFGAGVGHTATGGEDGGGRGGGGGASAGRKVLARRGAPVVLTPHEGEFTRLTTTALGWDADDTGRQLATDRLGTVRQAAAALGATVLLKGNRTLIVEPGGAARVNTTGTPWLGSAGTGDVLTGLAGSLLAAGLGALDAVSVAAHLHGLAGQLAPRPLSAADLPALLPAAVARVLASTAAHRPSL